MTKGTVVVGVPSESDFYSSKSWSGGDDPIGHKNENGYSMSRLRILRTRAINYHGGKPVGYLYYDTTNWMPSSALWTSDMEYRLLGRLTDQLTDGAPNLGNMLGEGRTTLTSIVDLVGSGIQGWRRFRKGDFAGALRQWTRSTAGGRKKGGLKFADVSDAHLALTYGWVPLASDIYALCKSVERRLNGPRVIVYRASRQETFKNPNVGVGGLVIPAKGRIEVHLKYIMTEQVSYARALGLLDPVTVAWELVPFSFVADWFIPIGTYFQLLGLVPKLQGKFVRTVFRLGEADYAPGVRYLPPYMEVGGSVRYKHVSVVRTIGSSLDVPRPGLKNIRNALNLPHLTNAAALVLSLVKPLRAL